MNPASLATCAILFLLGTAEGAPAVRRCYPTGCVVLSVQNGQVVLESDPAGFGKDVIGRYLQSSHGSLRQDELPVASVDLTQWHAVVTAALLDTDGFRLRLRLLNPGGQSVIAYDADGDEYHVDQLRFGRYLPGCAEVLALQTSGLHSYVIETAIWCLGAEGPPQKVLSVVGVLVRFARAGAAGAEIVVDRQTYDGVDGSTKGWRTISYAWDGEERVFTLRPGEGPLKSQPSPPVSSEGASASEFLNNYAGTVR